MQTQWEEVRKKLRESLSKGQYDFWVSTIECVGFEDGCLILGCRNRFHVEWLREKLESKLAAIAKEQFPAFRRLDYRVVSADQETTEEEEGGTGLHQLKIDDLVVRSRPQFNQRFTFDHFVVGKCNQFAYAASMGMASGRQMFNQSVYLIADAGLGKSHLSHAVGNYMLHRHPGVRVRYATTEQFANEMIFALKQGNIEVFKNKYRTTCDMLLLEKIEFLSGKEKVQSELAYTLDELMDRGKRVLCTGSAHPRDIPKLNSSLQSRLGGTLLATIEPPDFDTRLEIVRRKSQIEGVRLPEDVAEFLANQINGDVRQLESSLVGIIAKSSILKVPISVQLAQEVSQTMFDRILKITVDRIQETVCEVYQISRELLISNSRKRELTIARKIGMYLCRQYTSESLEGIGRAFRRSHSSTVYAVQAVRKEMEDSNSKVKRQVDHVSRRLEISCLYT